LVFLNCAVDHIPQKFYTLFLTRFRTYKIASQPQTKWPLKMTLRDWCLKSSFVHGSKERFFLATGGWNEHKNALDRRGRRGENTGTEKAEVRGGKMRLSERGGWGERWY
jgi:hypothetical protein